MYYFLTIAPRGAIFLIPSFGLNIRNKSRNILNMAYDPLNIGINRDSLRSALLKIDTMMQELYAIVPEGDFSAISQSVTPDGDNTYDLGSPTNRWRSVYVGPNSLHIGNATLSTTSDNKVIVPGISEPLNWVAADIIDLGYGQSTTWPGAPEVIDRMTYLNLVDPVANPVPPTWTAAVYSATVDNDGFIDAITIVSGGAEYSDSEFNGVQDVATIVANEMYAAPAGTTTSPFNAGDWSTIPFGVDTSSSGIKFTEEAGGSFQIAWADILSKPTTLVDFGITDAQPLDDNLNDIVAVDVSVDGTFLSTDGNNIVVRTEAETRTQLGLSAVATSNDYTDLDNLPSIPTSAVAFSGDYGDLINKPTSYTGLTGIGFSVGVVVSEFSSDGTLSGNSNTTVPTEQAVKTYVDTQTSSAVSSFSNIAVSGQNTIVADSSQDTLTFVAGTGISITTNLLGDSITITNTGSGTDGGGGTGLAGRGNIDGTTTSIADGATENLTITGFKGYLLYKVQTNAAAWVRIYTSQADRTNDAGRVQGADPDYDGGVIAEVITNGADTITMAPAVIGFNNETIPTDDIYMAVTNLSGNPASITVTLTVVQVEV